jgi:DNA-binding GntR family transcriptional regulator
VDALSLQQDRMLFLDVHQKLHSRIAQCARCPALLDAIEKTHALSSIWFCAMRQPRDDDSPTRHSELIEEICSNDSARGAEAVRHHLVDAMRWTMDILEPYFKLRKAAGRTFHRSDRKMKPPDGLLH